MFNLFSKKKQSTSLYISYNDDKTSIRYAFNNPYDPNIDNSELMKIFVKYSKKTIRNGKNSHISNFIKYKTFEEYKLAIYVDSSMNVVNAFPYPTTNLVTPFFTVYNYLFQKNNETDEYIISKTQNINASQTEITGDIKMLEIFLNYGISNIRKNDLINVLKTAPKVVYNDILITRQNGIVSISFNYKPLEILFKKINCSMDESFFNQLLDTWCSII